MPKRTRQHIRSDRLWKHWLYWLGDNPPFALNLQGPIPDYKPEDHRKTFEYFQTHGAKTLSSADLVGIYPLLCAQKSKEILLTSLATESMDWWAKSDGWAYPWLHTLDTRKEGRNPMDRLTYVAILRTMKNLAKDPHGFFERHPGIPADLKALYFAQRAAA